MTTLALNELAKAAMRACWTSIAVAERPVHVLSPPTKRKS